MGDCTGASLRVEAFVFDMDGTILHTLPDLAIAANEALTRLGYPTRSYEEILGFMGNGAQRLIESSLPACATDDERARTFALWRSIYLQSDYAHTEPFPGIVDTLHALRGAGVKTAVLSNKFDAGVQALSARFFPGLFDIARGEVPPTPRKPDPTSLLQVLCELDVPVDAAAYVGDTQVDVEVARNAGVRAIGVSWGYDTANPLPVKGLDAYIHSPEELLSFRLCGKGIRG
jgi:phosphoglycolate phosphatase